MGCLIKFINILRRLNNHLGLLKFHYPEYYTCQNHQEMESFQNSSHSAISVWCTMGLSQAWVVVGGCVIDWSELQQGEMRCMVTVNSIIVIIFTKTLHTNSAIYISIIHMHQTDNKLCIKKKGSEYKSESL